MSQGAYIVFAEVAGISQDSVRNLSKVFFNLINHGNQLLIVVGLLRDIRSDYHLTATVHHRLPILCLFKGLCGSVEHDPTVRVSEISLFLRLHLRCLGSSACSAWRRFSIITALAFTGVLLSSFFFKGMLSLPYLLKTSPLELQFFGKLVAFLPFALLLVRFLAESLSFFQKLLHLCGKLFFPVYHAIIAHGLVLRSVGFYLGRVKSNITKFYQPRLLAYLQDLHEQTRNGDKMPLTEVRNPGVIRMAVTTEDPESNVLVSLLLYATGTPYPEAVPIEQKLYHHGRVISRMSTLKMEIFLHNLAQNQRVNHGADK